MRKPLLFSIFVILSLISCTKKEGKYDNMSIDNPYLPKIEMSEIREMEFIVEHRKYKGEGSPKEKIELTESGKTKLFNSLKECVGVYNHPGRMEMPKCYSSYTYKYFINIKLYNFVTVKYEMIYSATLKELNTGKYFECYETMKLFNDLSESEF